MNKKMMMFKSLVLVLILCVVISCGGDDKSTTSITKIHMFGSGDNRYSGNLGGRSGADAIITANLPSSLSNVTIHALISIDETDCIANMPVTFNFPANVPIYGPDGVTLIADNWADLLDGSIKVTLEDAGVLGSSSSFWTGSYTNGTLVLNSHCNNWTSSNASVYGTVGNEQSIDYNWIQDKEYQSTSLMHLVGICY